MIKKFLFSIVLIFLFSFFSFWGCLSSSKSSTNSINQNNLQNILENKNRLNNFTYFIQNERMTPIQYEINDYLIKPFDFYKIYKNKEELNFDFEKNKPSFLQNRDISFFNRCDQYFDYRLYNEVLNYFSYLFLNKDFNQILNYLIKYNNKNPPSSYEIQLGDIINVYQNGIEYRYPLEKGATIIEFIDKSYQIKFSDGRIFYLLSDGIYFETYEDGSEIYYVDPNNNYFRIWIGSILLTKSLNFIEIQVGTSSISLYKENKPIIKYYQPKNFELYIYLKDNFENFDSIITNFNINNPNIERLLYKTSDKFFISFENIDKSVFFNIGNYLISLKQNLIKTIYLIDSNSNKKLLSIFLPEGIKLYEFNSQYSKSEVNLVYNYKKLNLGKFCFYYSDGVENLIKKIDNEELEKIINIISNNLNWQINEPIVVILPEDIYEYQSLLSGSQERKFSYLPDGFTRDDIIIFWPLNLPRYYEDKDMKYFFEKEFYTLLLFQLVKKISYQQVAYFSRLPYFIQIGLPLYIASLYDEDLKNYNEKLFNILMKNNFTFDKALLILTNPESTPMPTSKYIASISYMLIKYIFSIYEHNKITDFIRQFKIDINKENLLTVQSNQDFLDFSNKNIFKIFGVTLEKLMEAACLKTSGF